MWTTDLGGVERYTNLWFFFGTPLVTQCSFSPDDRDKIAGTLRGSLWYRPIAWGSPDLWVDDVGD